MSREAEVPANHGLPLGPTGLDGSTGARGAVPFHEGHGGALGQAEARFAPSAPVAVGTLALRVANAAHLFPATVLAGEIGVTLAAMVFLLPVLAVNATVALSTVVPADPMVTK